MGLKLTQIQDHCGNVYEKPYARISSLVVDLVNKNGQIQFWIYKDQDSRNNSKMPIARAGVQIADQAEQLGAGNTIEIANWKDLQKIEVADVYSLLKTKKIKIDVAPNLKVISDLAVSEDA